MALGNITNTYVQPNAKRRKLRNTPRRQTLIPSMLSINYNQHEMPNIQRRRSLIPVRKDSSNLIHFDMCDKKQITDALNCAKVEYDNLKMKFAEAEKKIADLRTCHHYKMMNIEQNFVIKAKTMKSAFEMKLTEIVGGYEEKICEIVDIESVKSQKRISELETVIKSIDKKINYTARSLFKDQQERLDKEHDLEIDKIRKSYYEKLHTLEEEKAEHQNKRNDLNKDIALNKKRLDNILYPQELKLGSLSKKRKLDYDKVKIEELRKLKDIERIRKELEFERESINQMKNEVKTFMLEQTDYEKLLLEEQSKRRLLHNKLQELKGNIRVFCRLKPSGGSESFQIEKKGFLETRNGKQCLIIKDPAKKSQKSLISPTKSRANSFSFYFDIIFDQQITNEYIFHEISQLVQSALDGYNVCIFTYGQTGSGKTFTMSNPKDGLIPLSLKQIFDRIDKLSSIGWSFDLQGQFFEIYGDFVQDLLSDSKSSSNDTNHVGSHHLKNIEQIDSILSKATLQRATASTNSNNASSRSHSIFRFAIKGKDDKGKEFESVLNLVDLAGSERVNLSQVKGQRLKETQAINKSLSALGDVIDALSTKSNHVPYRNSKLTYLLKDSLGGQSKTLMFVNVSCLKEHFNESLNSLRFASKVNNTKTI